MQENATFIGREMIDENLGILRIKLDNPIKFLPGQYITIAMEIDGKPVGRPYSISSPPSQQDIIELYVKKVENGIFTSRLFSLDDGTRITVLPVKGRFVYEDDSRNSVFIASGTGLGPYISMLKHLVDASYSKKKKIILVHGTSHEKHLAYRDFLEDLEKDKKLNFTYLPTISRHDGNTNWNGLRGRAEGAEVLQKLSEILGDEFIPEKTAFYLCGHPKMIENYIEILKERNFKKALDIHFERYWVE